MAKTMNWAKGVKSIEKGAAYAAVSYEQLRSMDTSYPALVSCDYLPYDTACSGQYTCLYRGIYYWRWHLCGCGERSEELVVNNKG
jgi:hypothetical protein